MNFRSMLLLCGLWLGNQHEELALRRSASVEAGAWPVCELEGCGEYADEDLFLCQFHSFELAKIAERGGAMIHSDG